MSESVETPCPCCGNPLVRPESVVVGQRVVVAPLGPTRGAEVIHAGMFGSTPSARVLFDDGHLEMVPVTDLWVSPRKEAARA